MPFGINFQSRLPQGSKTPLLWVPRGCALKGLRAGDGARAETQHPGACAVRGGFGAPWRVRVEVHVWDCDILGREKARGGLGWVNV